MITAIEIENFKGVGDRVRIELKPITLLFGPNSAGKSTILHALHYAREILERHNLDADRTAVGGDFVDLGGFRNFVNDRDLDRTILLRFDMDLANESLPDYGDPDPMDAYSVFDEDFAGNVRSATIEIAISWNKLRGSTFVERYAIELNGEPLASIRCDYGRREVALQDLNWEHGIFLTGDPPKSVLSNLCELEDILFVDNLEAAIPVAEQDDALPIWGQALNLGGSAAESPAGRKLLTPLISQLLVRPGELLRDALGDLLYLGPLRMTPARNYVPPRHPEDARWANGIAAWDALFGDDADLVERTNHWLSDADRLATGYSLRVSKFKEVDVGDPLIISLTSGHPFDDADLAEVQERLQTLPTRRRLLLVDEASGAELLPHDVGEGISQVLPVVVAALLDDRGLLAIEQPELHVHPAIQVGLGDLFIEGMRRGRGPLLIETHSEHVLLRLLRRIRETSEEELPADHPKLRPSDLSVYFMELIDGRVKATPLRIDETGEFIDRWPRGFFEERAEELFS